MGRVKWPTGKRSRYGIKRVELLGVVYDSAKEGKHHHDLLLLEKAGRIHHLRRQVPYEFVINGNPLKIRSVRYPNGRRVKYIADFVYRDDKGDEHVVDVKGKDTPLSRQKRALMEAVHGIRVEIV